MGKRLRQLLNAAIAPVLTVACTVAVAGALGLADELAKAVGAAIAGVLLFVAIELTDELPKRSWSWRRRVDPRAAFEGWWLQIHEKVDRAAVFSFLYIPDSDTYRAEGHAFDSKGELLAHWYSTQVFFSTGALSASYLWDGKSYEQEPPVERRGTTSWSVQRSSRRILPSSGHGEVLHLNQDRTLTFRAQRLTRENVHSLLEQVVELDSLVDFELQRRLAVAFLAVRTTGVGTTGPAVSPTQ